MNYDTYYKILTIIYCAYLLIASLVMLMMYKNDKKRAINGSARIKEKNLLLGSILGGAIGSFIGRLLFHHKTDKKYFSLVIYLNLVLDALVLVLLVTKLV